MSAYADLRAQLRDALVDAAIPAFLTKPDVFTPPAAFVVPGDPYITREGQPFGAELVHHDVTLVVAAGVNEVQAEALDDLIAAALDALLPLDVDGVFTGDVARPGQVSINGQAHLAAAIEVRTEIRR